MSKSACGFSMCCLEYGEEKCDGAWVPEEDLIYFAFIFDKVGTLLTPRAASESQSDLEMGNLYTLSVLSWRLLRCLLPRLRASCYCLLHLDIVNRIDRRYLDSEMCECSDNEYWALVYYGPPTASSGEESEGIERLECEWEEAQIRNGQMAMNSWANQASFGPVRLAAPDSLHGSLIILAVTDEEPTDEVVAELGLLISRQHGPGGSGGAGPSKPRLSRFISGPPLLHRLRSETRAVANLRRGESDIEADEWRGPIKWRDRWTLPEAHLRCHSKVSPSDGKRRPGSVYIGRLEMRELEGLNTLIGEATALELKLSKKGRTFRSQAFPWSNTATMLLALHSEVPLLDVRSVYEACFLHLSLASMVAASLQGGSMALRLSEVVPEGGSFGALAGVVCIGQAILLEGPMKCPPVRCWELLEKLLVRFPAVPPPTARKEIPSKSEAAPADDRDLAFVSVVCILRNMTWRNRSLDLMPGLQNWWLADEERLPLSPVERLGFFDQSMALAKCLAAAEAQTLGEKMRSVVPRYRGHLLLPLLPFFYEAMQSLKWPTLGGKKAGDVVLVSDAVVRPGRGACAVGFAAPPLLQRTASAMQVSWMEAAQSLRQVAGRLALHGDELQRSCQENLEMIKAMLPVSDELQTGILKDVEITLKGFMPKVEEWRANAQEAMAWLGKEDERQKELWCSLPFVSVEMAKPAAEEYLAQSRNLGAGGDEAPTKSALLAAVQTVSCQLTEVGSSVQSMARAGPTSVVLSLTGGLVMLKDVTATNLKPQWLMQGDPGFSDGPLASAQLGERAVALANGFDGNILVADTSNHRIRRINSQLTQIETVAGQKDGDQLSATFSSPVAVLDLNGVIVVLEEGHPGTASDSCIGLESWTGVLIGSPWMATKLDGNGSRSGYASADDSEKVDLEVCCLNGVGTALCVPNSTLGREVRNMVASLLPCKAGAKIVLHHGASSLIMQQSLKRQGIVGAARLSCTYVPTNVYGAWCFLQGLHDKAFALEGVTRLEGAAAESYLYRLPGSLETLAFCLDFNHNLLGVNLPHSLQNLTFGAAFNQSLERVVLPTSLQSLRFGVEFNQSLEGVTLPSGLQSLVFGVEFNQSLESVTLPSSLCTLTFGLKFNQTLENVFFPDTIENLTFGIGFNQSLEGVNLPHRLQRLEFGRFNQSLNHVTLPASLQSLTFGAAFNQSLEHVALPSSLQSLVFGAFNQSLERVTLPTSLQTLTLGDRYNQRLDSATLPNSLQNLSLGADFEYTLDCVPLPSGLQSVTFGNRFSQRLEWVTLPKKLRNLTFGRTFNENLQNLILPDSLQSLTFGWDFNKSLKAVTLPSGLQHLTFGHEFDQSLEGVKLPSNLRSLTFVFRFNQSLENVILPSSIQTLSLSRLFNHSLRNVILPESLESLSFGDRFDQSIDRVSLPRKLKHLTFGHAFNRSLEFVSFPTGLESLKFGDAFNQNLQEVTFPSNLQSLTFGSEFSQSLQGVALPNSLQSLSAGECETDVDLRRPRWPRWSSSLQSFECYNMLVSCL
eukprot:s100_g45.t1